MTAGVRRYLPRLNHLEERLSAAEYLVAKPRKPSGLGDERGLTPKGPAVAGDFGPAAPFMKNAS